MTVVRISRGTYPAERHDEVTRRLDDSRSSLVPAIEALNGLVGYFVGTDRASCSIVNVSTWRTEADAQQMAELAEMQRLAVEFIELGVDFERPIVNYDSIWEISGSS